MDLALKKAVADRENAINARDGMTDQIVDLKRKIKETQNSVLENSQLKSSLKNSQLENESLKRLTEQYVADLQKLRAEDEAPELKVEKVRLETELISVNAELALAKEQLAEGLQLQKDLAQQSAKLIAFREENSELRKQLANSQFKLNKVSFFVKEATSISPRVTLLYNALVELKGKSGRELERAYSELEDTLKVKKHRHVKFEKGSAFVADYEKGLIKNDISDVSDGSFLLVVGYASTTGTAEINYELSAKRATSVAAVVHSLNKDGKHGQNVKAVFLGQTNRFSPDRPAENQVCEIWEITK